MRRSQQKVTFSSQALTGLFCQTHKYSVHHEPLDRESFWLSVLVWGETKQSSRHPPLLTDMFRWASLVSQCVIISQFLATQAMVTTLQPVLNWHRFIIDVFFVFYSSVLVWPVCFKAQLRGFLKKKKKKFPSISEYSFNRLRRVQSEI